MLVFLFKHKTAYEMRISGWSSDVCSSDLPAASARKAVVRVNCVTVGCASRRKKADPRWLRSRRTIWWRPPSRPRRREPSARPPVRLRVKSWAAFLSVGRCRSEEHTSELQSLMRISYAVFCLKKNNNYEHIYWSQIHSS